MGDNNSFIFDDDDESNIYQSEETPVEGGEPGGQEEPPADDEGGSNNNRTFLIAAGILGGVILLALICMAGYVLFLQPQQRSARLLQQTAQLAENTRVAAQATEAALALLPSATLEPATNTPLPTEVLASSTPVVAVATNTPIILSTPDPLTETVAAAYTQVALAQLTVVATSTALGQVPTTGFADEVGLPGLFILGIVMIVVILLARRLRSAPTR
jgi:hypothetical protein